MRIELFKSIRIDERITSYLFGIDVIDQKIRRYVELKEPISSFDGMIITDDQKKVIKDLMVLIAEKKRISNILFP